MASTLNASNSGAGGLISTADASGVLQLQSAGTTAVTIDTTQHVNIGGTTVTDAHLLNIQGPTTTNNVGVVLNDTTNNRIWAIDNGANTLKFYDYTAAALRMSIDSSGKAYWNTTSVIDNTVYNFNFTSANNGIGVKTDTTSTSYHFRFQNPNGTIGGIYTNASTTTYTTSSDYRLKENIMPMTGALDKVLQLNPVTYNWKIDGSNGQGFIAHELQAIVPECVGGEKDAIDDDGKPIYQGVDTSFLVATLTAAIKEQQTIINDLKARVTALEAK